MKYTLGDSAEMANLNEENWRAIDARIHSATRIRWSNWIKNWGVAGAFITACVAAAIFITTQISGNSKFQGATEEHFRGIEKDLVALRALIAANQPLKKQNQDAAKEVLAQARQEQTPPISESTVDQAGTSFVDVAAQSQGAWNVALDFAQYRSSLNLPPPSLAGATPLDLQQTGVLYTTQHVDDKPKPNLSHGPSTSFENGARLQIIGEPVLTLGREDIGFQFLILSGGTIDITNTQMRHVYVRNTEVHYREGPVVLEDVMFINCTFVFDNTDKARRLAQAILSMERVTLSV